MKIILLRCSNTNWLTLPNFTFSTKFELNRRLPNRTLLRRIHSAAFRTLPCLSKLTHVAQSANHAIPIERVIIAFDLALHSWRPLDTDNDRKISMKSIFLSIKLYLKSNLPAECLGEAQPKQLVRIVLLQTNRRDFCLGKLLRKLAIGI